MKKTILKEHEGKLLVRCDSDLASEVKAHAHEFWNSKEEFELSQDEETEGADQEGEPKCQVFVGMSDEDAFHIFSLFIKEKQ
ncbi:hypothetical protein [Paenibacillus sp. M2]|uniref:hypothetical protein n=1 Tax=Paenibacillus sp. M2 TaxID=3341793 RepID=UPI0039891E70